MESSRRPDSSRSAAERPSRPVPRGRATTGVTAAAERYIAGVPARIMRPRLVFLVCLAAIVGFGLLMVYSASSVEAATENGSATYFLVRQAIFAAIGFVGMEVIARVVPDSWFQDRVLKCALGAIGVLLVLVLLVGRGSRGATRWIDLGFFSFQPSEFLKPFAIAFSALMLDRVFSSRGDWPSFALNMGVYLGPSLGLIFIQPDFGTILIILVTLACMAIFAGADIRIFAGLVVAGVIIIAIAFISQPYRWVRFQVSLDPWADEYGDGYQATLAIMAFASGGLFGRGIGNSTMKYSYLPEAHNDYILAIIGEECGFVGTVLFIALFALMVYAAIKIAQQATTKRGALMASGAGVMLAIQFLINALGILNVFPMTGKPLPFISYGGSSIIVCFMLAGLILRTSLESARQDEYDRRRESFAVMDESTAGTPHVRGGGAARSGFTVLAGSGGDRDGANGVRKPPRQTPRPRSASGPYDRIDLNADPTARLRTDGSGPHVRRDYHDR